MTNNYLSEIVEPTLSSMKTITTENLLGALFCDNVKMVHKTSALEAFLEKIKLYGQHQTLLGMKF